MGLQFSASIILVVLVYLLLLILVTAAVVATARIVWDAVGRRTQRDH